jgi:hypothetical protein
LKGVTDVKEPSYTSHNHMWKGEAPTLKRKVVKQKTIPTVAVSILLGCTSNFCKTSNEQDPVDK